MTTSIKRKDLYLFSRIVNRVFGQHHKLRCGLLTPTAEGMELAITDSDAAVRLRLDGRIAEQRLIPWTLIKETADKTDDPVELEYGEKDITVRFTNRGIPKQENYPLENNLNIQLPKLPEQFESEPDSFFDRLTDASHYTDPNSTRYPLAYLALDGEKGYINATDGQAAIQYTGEKFPWSNLVLVPASKLFTTKEFRDSGIAEIGYHENWFTVRCGNCTVQFKTCEGRYPVVDRFFQSEDSMNTWVMLDEREADFLVRTIDELPGTKIPHQPVTIEIKDGIACLRAAEKLGNPTAELRLPGSICQGIDAVTSVNRNVFKKIIKSGCRKIGINGQKDIILLLGENRRVACMPLELMPITPAEDMAIISVTDSVKAIVKPQSPKHPVKTDVARAPVLQTAARAVKKEKVSEPTTENVGAIQTAELLVSALRDALTHANGLLRQTKVDARKRKAIKQTLDSIRQLQNIDA